MFCQEVPTNKKEWKELNDYFKLKSYVDGYKMSNADVELLEKMKTSPDDQYKHILRWYKHIQILIEENTVSVKETGVTNNVDVTVDKNNDNKNDDNDDDDLDLFGSDEEEDAEAERIKQERLKAYAEKKSKKPALIAKSTVVLDVKPWDDETDMKELEKCVRSIVMDGLLWGVSKLVPVGYGIHKLQIGLVIEDDKVSIDLLTEEIEKFEDYVQSVDIAAFNKI